MSHEDVYGTLDELDELELADEEAIYEDLYNHIMPLPAPFNLVEYEVHETTVFFLMKNFKTAPSSGFLSKTETEKQIRAMQIRNIISVNEPIRYSVLKRRMGTQSLIFQIQVCITPLLDFKVLWKNLKRSHPVFFCKSIKISDKKKFLW